MNRQSVYALLIDLSNQRIGVNLKDATMPTKLRQWEGTICFFGGAIEDGEDERMAMKRELEEEIPGFCTEEEIASMHLIFRIGELTFFGIHTSLSGGKTDRSTSRIGQLARACQEGDGVVRSFDFLMRTNSENFSDHRMQHAIARIVNSTGV